ncbi:hypothetical protein KBD34_04535 [Patescibacteria group bacterium]|nr:hypothetical protein [Patescibacteria group bacterium]
MISAFEQPHPPRASSPDTRDSWDELVVETPTDDSSQAGENNEDPDQAIDYTAKRPESSAVASQPNFVRATENAPARSTGLQENMNRNLGARLQELQAQHNAKHRAELEAQDRARAQAITEGLDVNAIEGAVNTFNKRKSSFPPAAETDDKRMAA